MSRFDADFYRRFRPYYPAEVFAELGRELKARVPVAASRRFDVADIGCGTGHSSESLLASGIPASVWGVDPDPMMLAQAEMICPRGVFTVGSGEATGLPDASFDAVTIASAFHWMEPLATRDEVLRVLRPQGLLLVYEYQFPKAQARPQLNEWIRREFNLRWKAPGQKPRGAFDEVTGCFRTDGRLGHVSDRRIPMIQPLDAAALVGLILSQSRVLHFENTLSSGERDEFRAQLGVKVSELLGNEGDLFDFSLQSACFFKQ